MIPTETDYTEHNNIARSMGLKGKNGHYTTPLGVSIDTTASRADRTTFGYLIAKEQGNICFGKKIFGQKAGSY